jgi:hypothetical protein
MAFVQLDFGSVFGVPAINLKLIFKPCFLGSEGEQLIFIIEEMLEQPILGWIFSSKFAPKLLVVFLVVS